MLGALGVSHGQLESTAPEWIASKLFLGIARNAHQAAIDLEPRLRELEAVIRGDDMRAALDPDTIEEWGKSYNTMAEHACSAIVFAAATAEAYIYDYGRRHTSAKFMHNYVEQLDLVANGLRPSRGWLPS